MSDIEDLQKKIVDFRDARNWKQFHNPKDMAISLSLESSEFLELFQWKSIEEVQGYLKANKTDFEDELADVLYWVLLIAHDLDIDLIESTVKKLDKNHQKYPIEKSKNSHKKYTEL